MDSWLLLAFVVLLQALFVAAAFWYTERRVSGVLGRVLRDEPTPSSGPAKVSHTPDAEEAAYSAISERSVERIASMLVEREGMSMERARKHALELVAQEEHFGATQG